MSIAIVDYGMGNLRSVYQAFKLLGFDSFVSNNPKEIELADKIVLPGVGAFKAAINTIKKNGIDEVIFKAVADKKPLLGICLGMQLMFDISFEDGIYKGLSILSGEIRKLPETSKIPHMGWNNLNLIKKLPLFIGLSSNPFVYFVHSYYLETSENIVSSTAFYGKDIFVSAQKDNIYAVQFHPEKSGDNGLVILKNFGGLK